MSYKYIKRSCYRSLIINTHYWLIKYIFINKKYNMGNLFSFSSATTEEDKKKMEELNEMIKQLEQQEQELKKSVVSKEQSKKEILRKAKERNKQNIAQREKEYNEYINTIHKLNDKNKIIYNNAALILCSIKYNFYNGNICNDIDTDWQDTSIFKNLLTSDVFWLLCKIPLLLPILWPMGSECDEYQDYTSDENYNTFIKSKLTSNSKYITSILPKYLLNICKSNCNKFNGNYNERRDNDYINKCNNYIKIIQDKAHIHEDFFKYTLKFIYTDFDYLQWKSLYARSKKGICTNEIKYIPSMYPKVNPKFELCECIMMLCNTIVNHYGDLYNSKGVRTNTNSSSNTTGGKCFSYELHKEAIDSNILNCSINTLWDCNTYELTKTHIIDNINNEEIYSSLHTYSETELHGETVLNENGYLKYINPTQKYTSQFINDIDDVNVELRMPQLSVEINDNFKHNFITNAFDLLQTEKYKYYNIFAFVNKNIFTSFEYLTLTPNGYEQIDNVSPVSKYMFEILVKSSCKWYLTFPLDNAMSMTKINNNFDMTSNDTIQSIWSSLKLNNTPTDNKNNISAIDTNYTFTQYTPNNIHI